MSQPIPSGRRHLPLDGAFNFRDVGGLATCDGRAMRPGILFRSDELSRLSARDLGRLGNLGLRSVCDLRTPNERKSKPDRLPARPGVRVVNIPIYPTGRDIGRWQFFWWLTVNSGTLDFEAQIRDAYRHFAFECTEQVGQIVSLISDQEALPAVIHCTAGKDRTGYVVALIQLLAGVPREAVVEDYLATNPLIRPHAGRYLRFLRWMSLFRISPERLQPVLEVRREYLDEILDEVLARHGTVGEYLAEACGVHPRVLAGLQRLLIERLVPESSSLSPSGAATGRRGAELETSENATRGGTHEP